MTDRVLKVVLLGARGVGKTTFLQRFQGLPSQKHEVRGQVRMVDSTLPPQAPLTLEVHVIECTEDYSYDPGSFADAKCMIYMFSLQDHSSISALEVWLNNHGEKAYKQLDETHSLHVFGSKCDEGEDPPESWSEPIRLMKRKIMNKHKRWVKRIKYIEMGKEDGIFRSLKEELYDKFQSLVSEDANENLSTEL